MRAAWHHSPQRRNYFVDPMKKLFSKAIIKLRPAMQIVVNPWHRDLQIDTGERENQVTRWFFSFLKHPMNPTGITGESTVHVQCTADSRCPTHRATSVLFSYVQQVIISFVSNVVSRSTGHRGCALAPNFEHYYCLSKSKSFPTANQEGKLAHVFFLKKEKTLLLY